VFGFSTVPLTKYSSFGCRNISTRLRPLGCPWRIVLVAAQLLAAISVLHLVVSRGFLPEFWSPDAQQLYYNYFHGVWHNQRIWISEEWPVIYQFLLSRGMGVHLFFAAFTGPYVGQWISVGMLLIVGLISYQVITTLLDAPLRAWGREVVDSFATLGFVLTINTPGIVRLEFSKFHVHSGGLLLLFLYSLHLYLTLPKAGDRRRIRRLLLLLAAATPISYPPLGAIQVVLIGLALVLYRAMAQSERMLGLIAIAGVAVGGTALSLAINQAHIGVGELNPFFLFIKFANTQTLSQWSSVALVLYPGLVEDVTFSSFGSLVQRVAINGWASISAVTRWLGLFATGAAFLALLRSSFERKLAFGASLMGVWACWFKYGGYDGAWPGALLRISPMVSNGLDVVAVASVIFVTSLSTTIALQACVKSWAFGGFLKLGRDADSLLLFLVAYLGVTTMVIALITQGSVGRLFAHSQACWMIVAVVTVASAARSWTREADSNVQAISVPAVSAPVTKMVRCRWLPTTALGAGSVCVAVGFLVPGLGTNRMGLVVAFLCGASVSLLSPGVHPCGVVHRKISVISAQRSVVIAAGMLAILALETLGAFYSNYNSLRPFTSIVWYFTGRQPAVDLANPTGFRRCMEVNRLVPGKSKILPVNGALLVMPCYAPTRFGARFVMNLENIAWRNYWHFLFLEGQELVDLYRNSGINFFLVFNEDPYFWGPTTTSLFDPEEMAKYFAVYASGSDFHILTLRKSGDPPIPAQLLLQIGRLRAIARQHRPFSQAFVARDRLRHEAERDIWANARADR
jgi:hypothetical protein